MDMSFGLIGSVAFGAFCAAVLVVWFVLQHMGRVVLQDGQKTGADPIRLVLIDGVLADVSERARRALDLYAKDRVGWADVRAALVSRFPDLATYAPPLCAGDDAGGPGYPPPASATFYAADGAYVAIKTQAGQTSVEIWDVGVDAVDGHRAFRLQNETDVLRAALDSAPDPIWHTRHDGALVWANLAFREVQGDENISFSAQAAPRPGEVRRVRLNQTPDHSGEWFDLRCVPHGDGTLNYAVNVESVVKAEIAQRNFVQTLAKTFAHLPIGLAIFDRNRQLALFNPALIDLTALPAEFLSGRPNLMTFFDTLREARMMPEPKNYSDWREQLAELVRATCDDRYSETWTLPSGLTYKITGRPHPDGAIAFLIEDISAEISLTRRFRAELSQSQAALDAVDDGIAVFSPLGVLTMCNQKYRKTWGTDPDETYTDVNILDELRRWQAICGPSQVWTDLRQHIMGRGTRDPWAADMPHARLGLFRCHVTPIAGGDTLLRFEDAPKGRAAVTPPPRQVRAMPRAS